MGNPDASAWVKSRFAGPPAAATALPPAAAARISAPTSARRRDAGTLVPVRPVGQRAVLRLDDEGQQQEPHEWHRADPEQHLERGAEGVGPARGDRAHEERPARRDEPPGVVAEA